MTDLRNSIYWNQWQNLPRYPLIITFDDGWKENYDLLDIFIRRPIKPTIFLTSHLIDSERNLWFTACSGKEKERLKNLPNSQRIKELKEKWSFHQEKEFPGNRQVLNSIEISKMKRHVEFGLHTCYHAILTNCTEEEKTMEIVECKKKIENLLDMPIDTFAYPNGNYDEDCIKILKENGIKIARTIDAGWNSIKTDPYRLKITGVSDTGNINKLASELTGIPLFFQYWLLEGNFGGLKQKLSRS